MVRIRRGKAAGALGQHRISCGYPALARQCDPGGYRSTWQGCGFLEGEVARHIYERLLAQHCIFRQHPIEIGAEPVGQYSGLIGPPNQRGWKQPATRSPILTRVTPAPIEATSPAPSDSDITPSLVGPRPPPFISSPRKIAIATRFETPYATLTYPLALDIGRV